MLNSQFSRRHFLATAGGALFASRFASAAPQPSPPAVSSPRATSGDTRYQPNWDQRLRITVGPQKADIVGTTEKALQSAVDYLTRFGGGTVHVLPGEYQLRNSVFLNSNVRIEGSGDKSVLIKNKSHTAALSNDSDWYDQEVTLSDGHGFDVGDGVCLVARNVDNGSTTYIKRTLVARSGNRFKLDRALRKNIWLKGDPKAKALFPMFTGDHVSDILIENIVLDGNRDQNENFNGNYGGCIFLQDCNRIEMRGVTTRNYNGDGISWQICHDVTVENCHSHDNADLGLHPGSGSQRPIIRHNRLEDNGIGIFFCWGVKYGLAANNEIRGSRRQGISIGHCDTNNLIQENKIYTSGQVGVLFRDDSRGKDFWPNQNRLVRNQIIDSGPDTGYGIDVQGKTREVTIEQNAIIEKRSPAKRTGIRIGAQTKQIELRENKISGFSVDVLNEQTDS